jgi:hypothetical protein
MTASVFTTRDISVLVAGAACTVTSGASSLSLLPQPVMARLKAASKMKHRVNPDLLLLAVIVG